MKKTRLEEIITRRGLQRKDIAKALQIERRTLDNYINEVTLMNSEVIVKLAKYLKVSTDYLLKFDDLSDDFLNNSITTITNEFKELIYHLKKDN